MQELEGGSQDQKRQCLQLSKEASAKALLPSQKVSTQSLVRNLQHVKEKGEVLTVDMLKKGRELRREAKKGLKQMKEARRKLHRHAGKLGKKVHKFLKGVNSKRLIRRVLIANAWL